MAQQKRFTKEFEDGRIRLALTGGRSQMTWVFVFPR